MTATCLGLKELFSKLKTTWYKIKVTTYMTRHTFPQL
jgi:hypothetical protein